MVVGLTGVVGLRGAGLVVVVDAGLLAGLVAGFAPGGFPHVLHAIAILQLQLSCRNVQSRERNFSAASRAEATHQPLRQNAQKR